MRKFSIRRAESAKHRAKPDRLRNENPILNGSGPPQGVPRGQVAGVNRPCGQCSAHQRIATGLIIDCTEPWYLF
jgi:hypothetical protein